MQSDHSSAFHQQIPHKHSSFLLLYYFFNIPHSKATRADIFLAVKINSFAFASPINRGSRCVPPAPGIIPQLVSVSPSFTSSAAIAKSHASTSSNPPPNAYPLIAAMVGCGSIASTIKNISYCLHVSSHFFF